MSLGIKNIGGRSRTRTYKGFYPLRFSKPLPCPFWIFFRTTDNTLTCCGRCRTRTYTPFTAPLFKRGGIAISPTIFHGSNGRNCTYDFLLMRQTTYCLSTLEYAPKLGFEPRLGGSKSPMRPLHYFGILIFFYFYYDILNSVFLQFIFFFALFLFFLFRRVRCLRLFLFIFYIEIFSILKLLFFSYVPLFNGPEITDNP